MRVLLVDDHPLILHALQMVIQDLGEDVHVATANTAVSAREMLAEGHANFDLMLLDLHLGEDDGFLLLEEFRRTYPELPVVVVSGSERTVDMVRAIDMGAMGFVPKKASRTVLIAALNKVMSGGVYVPQMDIGLQSQSAGPDWTVSEASGLHAPTQPDPQSSSITSVAQLGLTPRQYDTLMCLIQGKSNKAIARELDVSVETVKSHIGAVLRGLGVSSRTQAVLALSQMVDLGRELQAWKARKR